ncbi:MAG TPA: hypothetical protein VNJ02_19620 [Vicinamibacterales bacterium]|nr:hypothetical protein [Vicinamibacterales bacterium]
MKLMKYEFRNAGGRICCSADNPDYLCDTCKARLPAVVSTDGYATALAARGITTAAVVLTNGIPDGYATALARKETR